jgi:hypothetical protein
MKIVGSSMSADSRIAGRASSLRSRNRASCRSGKIHVFDSTGDLKYTVPIHGSGSKAVTRAAAHVLRRGWRQKAEKIPEHLGLTFPGEVETLRLRQDS